MQAFTSIEADVTVFERDNVDTDLIIPARHLKTISRTGLGRYAFETLRYNESGQVRNESPFDPDCGGILLAGENFGCGSSREHAVWALMDLGVRVVLAPSFADIFRTNAVRNGLVTIELDGDSYRQVRDAAASGRSLTVDLEVLRLTSGDDLELSFDYPEDARHVLLNGLDEISETLKSESSIVSFESDQRDLQPWLYRAPTL